MIRAQYVTHQDGKRLFAVYHYNVKPGDLMDVVRQLKTLPGVKAGATRAAFGEGARPTAVVWMTVDPGYNPFRPQQRMKELTNPELPIAIHRINVRWRRCRKCNDIKSACEVSFLPGFRPDSNSEFRKRLYQEVGRMKLVRPWDTSPDFIPNLVHTMEQLLGDIGAFATELLVDPQFVPGPCSRCR